MSSVVFPGSGLILHICSLRNLYASGYMYQILQTVPTSVTLAEYVWRKREEIYIYSDKRENEGSGKELIDLQPLLQEGLLTTAMLSSEQERVSQIQFAAVFQVDAEAHAVALALHRQWAVCVDDPPTAILFRRHAPALACLSTLDLVKHWIEATSPPIQDINQVLHNMQRRAFYRPPKTDQLLSEWTK